jgi:hypothetical protein
MPRNRFVSAETARLDLSDGDWVEVKGRLGVAEEKKIQSAIFRGVQGIQGLGGPKKDVELRVDTSMAYMIKLKTYLVDWSFEDEKGKRVKVTEAAIEALDEDTADEIMKVLDAYLEAQKEERELPFTKKS